MSEIMVKCVDQNLLLTATPNIYSGDVNYDTVSFSFCERWDGFAKTAIFYRDKSEVYYQILDRDDKCTIPKEVLRERGTIYIGVFGNKEDQVVTSQVLTYRILDGAITEDLTPPDPTLDIYEQLLSAYSDSLNHIEQRFQDFNDLVDNHREDIGKQIEEYAQNVNDIADLSKSYAMGDTGLREDEEIDNAKYYKEQAEKVVEAISGSLVAIGTVTFEVLATVSAKAGYMYNISNDFTTDETFIEGAGINYPKGTNVYMTSSGLWDCLAGGSVLSVNGQSGVVEITPENIGAVNYDEVGGIKDILGSSGIKNLLPLPYSDTQPIYRGVDYTVSSDGIITATGKVSTVAPSSFYLYNTSRPLLLDKGTYTLSGCPSDESATGCYLVMNYFTDGGALNLLGSENGEGFTFTLTKPTNVIIFIQIKENTEVDNLVFKPMLVRGTEVAEFKPYTKTITEALAGCWIEFKDADGNVTDEPYIHWYAEED